MLISIHILFLVLSHCNKNRGQGIIIGSKSHIQKYEQNGFSQVFFIKIIFYMDVFLFKFRFKLSKKVD